MPMLAIAKNEPSPPTHPQCIVIKTLLNGLNPDIFLVTAVLGDNLRGGEGEARKLCSYEHLYDINMLTYSERSWVNRQNRVHNNQSCFSLVPEITQQTTKKQYESCEKPHLVMYNANNNFTRRNNVVITTIMQLFFTEKFVKIPKLQG